ncbi:uncharacterized protein LOC114246756 [Bombyx mandarina]|uniref:Uncharacterized protein LOC114246756 n=1 Tax=Bombyx mandarina TaxID=7092 RepID=A0A6J2K2L1_BOMMA|nr:uncharacterized protein LOC114246756 [Bombyx mandarina]
MPPLILEDVSLGRKHKQFNKLVKDAANTSLDAINTDESDLDNLLKIEIACKTRKAEYILEVFKCKDMLYISKAIKHSTWLIKDKQYSHFINPTYLHNELFPNMLKRGINKLMLHIRLNLKDEIRVEEFYHYVKDRQPQDAYKWLQNCSLGFIETVIKEESNDLPVHILKRLCEKSFSILKIFNETTGRFYGSTMSKTLFLIKKEPEKFLDLLENVQYYRLPAFGPKYTKILMEKCPQRILDNFPKFAKCVDCECFSKYLKPDEIQSFLLKHVKNDELDFIYTYNNFIHFIKRMPQKGRFEFIQKIFIDKDLKEELGDCDRLGVAMSSKQSNSVQNSYVWYKFAPFDVAFVEIKKLIRAESSPIERNSMMIVLLKCAGNNLNDIRTVLQYYHDKHINEPFKFKIQFVNTAISNIKAIKNHETWSLLNTLFHSMEVYVESENNVQKCIEIIIVHNVIVGETNQEIVIKKFSFNTMKSFAKILNQEEKTKLFSFLYDHLQTQLTSQEINDKTSLVDNIGIIKNILLLIQDWKKHISDFPFVWNKIQELMRIKKDNSWDVDFSFVYNLNKAWRRHMFKESIALSPTEIVFMNALKHDPNLLVLYNNDIKTLCEKETMSLRMFLSKLRTYWPQNLAIAWKEYYFERLENSSVHKFLIQNLISLLSQKELLSILKKYAPSEKKINWSEENERLLSIRKNIAKLMHMSRPLLPIEVVLLYAKGDYLQFTVPSLTSILQNSSQIQTKMDIPLFMNAPVSLQKIGINFAFNKLQSKELKPLLSDLWMSTKNSSIRAVLFKLTFDGLCKEKNDAEAEELWKILESFIENLSSEENKNIYNMLGKIKTVPLSIRGRYYMRSYILLKSLPPKANCHYLLDRIIDYAPEVMDLLESDFVEEILIKPMTETLNTTKCEYFSVIASYLLQCKDIAEQNERFERILSPLLDNYLPRYHEEHEQKRYVRCNIEKLLESLTLNVKDTILKKKNVIPLKMFKDILIKLENSLSMVENYQTFTAWKLTLAFIQVTHANEKLLPAFEPGNLDDSVHEKLWEKFIFDISVPLAKEIIDILNENVKAYSLAIVTLFGETFEEFLRNICYYNRNDLLKYILQSSESEGTYIFVTHSFIPFTGTDEDKEKLKNIKELIKLHPSPIVQIHYHNKLDNSRIESF